MIHLLYLHDMLLNELCYNLCQFTVIKNTIKENNTFSNYNDLLKIVILSSLFRHVNAFVSQYFSFWNIQQLKKKKKTFRGKLVPHNSSSLGKNMTDFVLFCVV